MMLLRPSRLAVVLLSLASVTACVKTQAKTPAPRPALATPAPPPRMHIPVSVEPAEPPITEPPAEPATPPAATRPREVTTRVPPPATATPPTTPPTTTTAPPVPDAPVAVLQTSPNIGALEYRANRLIEEAVRDLRFVKEASLSRGGKEQFTSAQRFVRQAREAVASKNFLYATQLADKAARLAKLLNKG